ncbi:hypothetical protein GOBAR_AA26989 [Gossypium barbadense]|uniref:DUF4283 domain-containing protein n=1 Tax=Gossypium barbadense TaxID=3634 RepID=A0A2P5WRK0_GOSBA|nr:hypothetical protein GOBAR_AA26989 [Gossypium barbadense]
MANLNLVDEEEKPFQEDSESLVDEYKLSLVGIFLTKSVVYFPLLRNTMANLWHPIGGISITDLDDKKYLFQFFYEVNQNRVLKGTPWFFNNHLLILHKIMPREDSSMIPLIYADFWVRIHDLPLGLMSEAMAHSSDLFLSSFLDYDVKMAFMGRKRLMRIKVKLEVWLPLKQKRRLR